IPFMIGVLCGGIIFGTVAGFVSMVPYMMKDVHQLSTAEIGSVIIFPGTMSVIIFGYIGGILVDRRGPLYVLNRSEEHTSELQSRFDLVCRLLLEKKKD